MDSFLLADDETRTRDSLLGRQILYQLSYVRINYYLIFNYDNGSVSWTCSSCPSTSRHHRLYSVGLRPPCLTLAAWQLSYIRIRLIYNKPKTFSSLCIELYAIIHCVLLKRKYLAVLYVHTTSDPNP